MKRFTNAAALTVALGMVLVSASYGADVVLVGCTAGCGQPDGGKTVCSPVCETRTVTNRTYTDRTTDVCLPGSLLGALLHRPCACGCVKRQKDLVVHLRKTQECVHKCVPVHVPACATCVPGTPACSASCDSGCVPVTPGQPALIMIPSSPVAMPAGK
jgi:hypothetical protein